MTRNLGVGTILAVAALSAGCIDQRYLITSDPPGAMVLHNGAPIGATPVDDQFVYYGKHHFTLVKDGYETMQIDQDIPAPWYEYPPFDFVTEVLYPGRLHDVHAFHYQMRPAEPPNKEDVLERGKQLRSRGQALVGQEPPPPPTAEAPPAPPPLGPPMPAAPDGR